MCPPDDAPSAGTAVPLSQAVVEAVADREGVDPTEIEPPVYDPLYAAVDPEALDRLFETAGTSLADAFVSFEYEGYDVKVFGDGRVSIDDAAGTDDSVRPIEG